MTSRLATAVAFAITVLAGCGDGPSVIDRHDHSAFYDFGGFDDVAADDTNTADQTGGDVDQRDGWIQDKGDPQDTNLPDDAGNHDDTGDPEDTDEPQDTVRPDTSAGDPVAYFVADRAWESRALAMIGAAKGKIDLVHLEFLMYTDEGKEEISIATALKAAARRGVKVRVLLDDSVDDNPARVDDLNAVANITAKMDGSGKTTHVKMMVVDDSEVLVGSTNLSKSALHFNHEANLWITDRAAVSRYSEYFTSLWGNTGNTVRMNASMSATGILPIGDGEYPEAVGEYIEGARERVWLVMYDYNNESSIVRSLTNLLVDAAGRSGVDVRVFLEQTDDYAYYVYENNLETAAVLEDGGAEVRFDQMDATTDVVTHAKLLIIDDTVAVYSGNWSRSGLEYNHEAGALIDGVDSVTDDAEAYFETLWASGRSL